MGGMSRSTAWQLYFPESGFKEAFAMFANRENYEFICNTGTKANNNDMFLQKIVRLPLSNSCKSKYHYHLVG